jgi:hypothetical protein
VRDEGEEEEAERKEERNQPALEERVAEALDETAVLAHHEI